MTVGTIAEWSCEVGDEVGPGDGFCEIETDKAVATHECVDECFIAKILVGTGEELACGTPIMVTVQEERDIAAFADFVAPVAAPAAAPAAAAPAAAAPAPAAAAPAAAAGPSGPVAGAWWGAEQY